MASKLYVRTGSGGGDAAVAIADLGFTIPTGASWTLLAASGPSDPEGNSGQFTSRELRDSKDLFDAISGSTLEWSKDGAAVEPAGDYLGDFMLMQDFTDDTLDLSDGRLVLPNGTASPASGVEGETFWDSDDDTMRVWDGTQFLDIQTGATNHGALTGLGDDDHTQYGLLAGDLTRNIFTGGADFSSASGLIVPTGTDRTGLAEVEGSFMWDTDDDQPWFYDGNDWISLPTILSGLVISTDHGGLFGLGDDDHPQYHNDTRGDARYYQQTEFIQTSAGAVDGGKPVELLDGVGLISNTMLLVSGHDVLMDRIAGSTYDDAQDVQDIFHSSGWTSGGVLSDAGGGNLDVAAGTGLIRDANDRLATLFFFDWASSTGNAIPSGTRRFVGVEYNGGSPQVVVKTTDTWNYQTEFPLGCVFNDGGTLEIIQSEQAVGDHAGFMIRRSYETMNIERDDLSGGLILGETGTRNVTMSAGALWQRLNRFAIGALDTSGSDTFDAYYRDGGSSFTKVSALTQWPNTQWDDNSGSLATLTATNFGVLWFYLELDGDLVAVYGRGDYATQAAAELESAPSTLPDRLTCGAKLIGRYIFGEGDATTTDIQTVFTTVFNTTGVTDHGDLSGLGDDDHSQYLELTGSAARNNVTGDILVSGELDVASGILTLPQAGDVPSTFPGGGEGDIAWDTDDDLLYVHNGSDWVTITSTITSGLDHGQLEGLGDDDHAQYGLLSGDLTRNAFTGGGDFSSASGLIVPTGTDRTGLAEVEGNIMWDTDDDQPWFFDGTEWISIPTILSGLVISTDHGGLFGLGDDDHTQYLTEARHDSLASDNPHSVTFTQAVSADGGTDISVAEAETLTDGSNADLLHTHTASGLSFDHSDLGNIGTDDHHTRYTDAEAVSAVGPHFSGSHTDLTGVTSDQHHAKSHDHNGDGSGSIDHGILTGLGDDDHPQYPNLGDNETISGIWTFDTDTNEPALVITPDTDAPTTNLVDGAIAIIDDLLSVYDATRGKWLSVDRQSKQSGRRGNATNIYMRTSDNIPSSQTGIRIPRPATIVGLTAQTDGSESWTFEVRKNGSATVIASLVISAASGGQDNTVNVDLDAGDELQFFCNGSAISAPIGSVELAWRETV